MSHFYPRKTSNFFKSKEWWVVLLPFFFFFNMVVCCWFVVCFLTRECFSGVLSSSLSEVLLSSMSCDALQQLSSTAEFLGDVVQPGNLASRRVSLQVTRKKKKHLHPQMKSLMLDNTSLLIFWKYESMLGEGGRRKIGLFMLLTFLV